MKLCFSTLGCYYMSLEETIALAKEYGISAVEIRGLSNEIENSKILELLPQNQENTLKMLKNNGITPITLGTSCSFHNSEKFESAVFNGMRDIEIAEAMGIKNIRVFGDKLTEDTDGCIRRITEGISRICSHSRNVTVLLEVHGEINTAETLKPIIQNLIDTENFGILWDIEHSHKFYGQNWIEFYKFIRPHRK